MGSHVGAASEEIELQPVGEDGHLQDTGSFLVKKLSAFWAWLKSIDDAVNKSIFGRTFRLRGSGHVRASSFAAVTRSSCNRRKANSPSTTQPEEIQDANFSTEIRAGLTTFATMSYIIAVNVSSLIAPAKEANSLTGQVVHPSRQRLWLPL